MTFNLIISLEFKIMDNKYREKRIIQFFLSMLFLEKEKKPIELSAIVIR